jgi:hypothetical protein
MVPDEDGGGEMTSVIRAGVHFTRLTKCVLLRICQGEGTTCYAFVKIVLELLSMAAKISSISSKVLNKI